MTRAGAATARLLCLVLLVPSPALAGRPLDTEDTEPVEPGHAVLEVGADYGRSGGRQAGRMTAVVTTGIVPRLDMSVQASGLLSWPRSGAARGGVGDTVGKAKLLVFAERARSPAILASAVVRMPTGDAGRGLGSKGYDVQALLAASKIVERWTIWLNGAYIVTTAEGVSDIAAVSGALQYRLTERSATVGEVVANVATRDGTAIGRLRWGWVLALHERATVDASVAVGIDDPVLDMLIAAGVTIALF